MQTANAAPMAATPIPEKTHCRLVLSHSSIHVLLWTDSTKSPLAVETWTVQAQEKPRLVRPGQCRHASELCGYIVASNALLPLTVIEYTVTPSLSLAVT